MNIDYKVVLVVLVVVGIVLFHIYYGEDVDEKDDICLRTLSVKNHGQLNAINTQMAVFYYQLGMWIKSNYCDGIFRDTEGLCVNMKHWTQIHRKTLETAYPGLPLNLRQQLALDLRTYMGTSRDPFGDIHKPNYLNRDRLNFIQFMQQKYNVHPDARI